MTHQPDEKIVRDALEDAITIIRGGNAAERFPKVVVLTQCETALAALDRMTAPVRSVEQDMKDLAYLATIRKPVAVTGEHDLTKCPKCGGIADNGIDRCDPPSVYYCSRCAAKENSVGDVEELKDNVYFEILGTTGGTDADIKHGVEFTIDYLASRNLLNIRAGEK